MTRSRTNHLADTFALPVCNQGSCSKEDKRPSPCSGCSHSLSVLTKHIAIPTGLQCEDVQVVVLKGSQVVFAVEQSSRKEQIFLPQLNEDTKGRMKQLLLTSSLNPPQRKRSNWRLRCHHSST